jgi:hypothetical protein
MAKPTWVINNPSSGSGNGTVNTSGMLHTGRGPRTGTQTYKAPGAPDVPQDVHQTGKPEFVLINDVSVPKGGGNITVTGKSNSKKLNFALGSGELGISLPDNYLAGGTQTTNNTDVIGDHGYAAEFDFAVTINVPANTTIAALSKIITVTADGGQAASANITQAVGDTMISVSPTSITVDWEGNPVAVTVMSNTNWTIE